MHEHAFVCPHCRDESGVPRDPEAERQIAALRKVPISPTPPPVSIDFDPVAAVVAGGVALVLELITTTADDETEPVPRAIARERSSPVSTRSREPEPLEPPAEQPRILK